MSDRVIRNTTNTQLLPQLLRRQIKMWGRLFSRATQHHKTTVSKNKCTSISWPLNIKLKRSKQNVVLFQPALPAAFSSFFLGSFLFLSTLSSISTCKQTTSNLNERTARKQQRPQARVRKRPQRAKRVPPVSTETSALPSPPHSPRCVWSPCGAGSQHNARTSPTPARSCDSRERYLKWW